MSIVHEGFLLFISTMPCDALCGHSEACLVMRTTTHDRHSPYQPHILRKSLLSSNPHDSTTYILDAEHDDLVFYSTSGRIKSIIPVTSSERYSTQLMSISVSRRYRGTSTTVCSRQSSSGIQELSPSDHSLDTCTAASELCRTLTTK